MEGYATPAPLVVIESVQRTSQRSFLQGFVPIGTVVLDEEQF
jgi:hypothetical protein